MASRFLVLGLHQNFPVVKLRSPSGETHCAESCEHRSAFDNEQALAIQKAIEDWHQVALLREWASKCRLLIASIPALFPLGILSHAVSRKPEQWAALKRCGRRRKAPIQLVVPGFA